MKEPLFTGVCTALVTPFLDGRINYPMVQVLLKRQQDAHIPAVVLAGTTGEAPTLSDNEKLDLFRIAKDHVGDSMTVIAGTGSNDTAHAVELSQAAQEEGADALLVVSPYYNKATPAGLYAHYLSIAHAVSVPIILYNVPSRTGCNILPSTYAKLADHPNIAGIKEANGNISSVVETRSLVGDKVALYSGNDDQIVPILSMGGQGVISVLSNVLPRQTVELCDKFFAGDVAGAAKMQCEMLELINALFCEVNPIPVKAAMAAMGWCEDILRLPLTNMEEPNRAKLLELMRAEGLNV